VTRRGVTVHIKATGRLQDAMDLHKALGYADYVRHKTRPTKNGIETSDQFDNGLAVALILIRYYGVIIGVRYRVQVQVSLYASVCARSMWLAVL
jgi:hypothetical protein